ncbi:MAG TPA: DUF2270 domain-containing protein [Anaerolineales bacterium]|nr:DUF2270 domain-containing protein [Anaerolineae bacterium]HIQ00944.1 DUF2270 domain-containing protein [Anaerolineales bacterium]
MTEQSESIGEEPVRVWSFRGYRLDIAHFTTAMAHLYRGEVSRANTWRTRLDATTNWAVITVGAALTFAFGSSQNPHFVLLLVLLLVLTFLNIEARRYRYYVLWSYRTRLMETDFFAPMLVPPFRPSPDWADRLAESLLRPIFPIARWEAVGRRFRRNYVWLITLLLISWGAKLALHPVPAPDGATVVERAAIGSLPGGWVMATVGAVYGGLVVLAAIASLPPAWREALPGPLRYLGKRLLRAAGPLISEPRPQERLATIITVRGRQIAIRLLAELGRGVTALEGVGMYTDEARDVLLCAVTEVQIPHLEEIVRQTDPRAFVIVSPAEEVRGRGFRPFEPPS